MTFLQRAQEKELTFSELLDLTREYIKSAPGRIFSHMILFGLPLVVIGGLLALIASFTFMSGLSAMEMNDMTSFQRDMQGLTMFASILPLIILGLLVLTLFNSWYFGSMVNWFYKDMAGLPATFKENATLGLKRTLRIFFTQILVAIVVGGVAIILFFIIGFLGGLLGLSMKASTSTASSMIPAMNIALIVLPIVLTGIVLMLLSIYVSFSQHVAALKETTGPWRAIKESISLVKGRFWRVLGRVLVAGIIVFAIDNIAQLLLGLLSGIHTALGSIAMLFYIVLMFVLSFAMVIYTLFMYLSLDSSKPEKEVVVS